jgi:hypothetical protein
LDAVGLFQKKQWHSIENTYLLYEFQQRGYLIHKSLSGDLSNAAEIPSGLRFWAAAPALLIPETKKLDSSLFHYFANEVQIKNSTIESVFAHWKPDGSKFYEVLINSEKRVSTMLQLELFPRLVSVSQPMAAD